MEKFLSLSEIARLILNNINATNILFEDKKWIQKAIKRPGNLREKARKEGAITQKGTIDVNWLKKKAKSKVKKLAAQARLALKLRKLSKRKKNRKKK